MARALQPRLAPASARVCVSRVRYSAWWNSCAQLPPLPSGFGVWFRAQKGAHDAHFIGGCRVHLEVPATCNMQRATCNMQRAMCSTRHATRNVRHTNMCCGRVNLPCMPWHSMACPCMPCDGMPWHGMPATHAAHTERSCQQATAASARVRRAAVTDLLSAWRSPSQTTTDSSVSTFHSAYAASSANIAIRTPPDASVFSSSLVADAKKPCDVQTRTIKPVAPLDHASAALAGAQM